MQRVARSVVSGLGTAVLALGVAGCGSAGGDSAGTGGGDGPELTITSPEDGGTVKQPVKLTWDSSEELGPPDSGKDHVHVYVDGNEDDYTVVGANRFTLKGLSAGEHEIEISLQHADHSDAGAQDSITVDVGGDGSDGSNDSDPGGYGY